MKKMTARAFAVLMLSFVLSCAFGATAFAADASANGVTTSSDTTLNIPKGVTFRNTDGTPSYGPGIEYTYTIAPATSEQIKKIAKVTDGNNSIDVQTGPEDGATLATSTVSFPSSEQYSTSSDGIEHTANMVVTVDTSKYSTPGVYRYVITDKTTTAALYAAGIVRASDYSTIRYLDVYIKRTAEGLAVSGYVLNNEALDGNKSAGFVAASENTAEATGTDRYRTVNIRLEKLVAGDMSDTNHEFPFTVTISNQGKQYYQTKLLTNFDTDSGLSSITTDSTSLNAKLKNGEALYIRGLSPKATVAYTEENDTGEPYTVIAGGRTSAETGDFTTINVTVDTTGTYDKHSIEAGAITDYDEKNSDTNVSYIPNTTIYRDVRFTNTLNEVSPTGVVLRFAPYIIMGCAGLLLLVLFVIRRREKDSSEF